VGELTLSWYIAKNVGSQVDGTPFSNQRSNSTGLVLCQSAASPLDGTRDSRSRRKQIAWRSSALFQPYVLAASEMTAAITR